MHVCYEDLLSLTDDEPQWFDEHAVPRFCAFEPRRVANIYASECALLEITCQGCGHGFRVALSWSRRDQVFHGAQPLKASIVERTLHYGDPPNIRCCPAGPTMNSEPRRVVQYWYQDHAFAWCRDPRFERSIKYDDDDRP